MIKIPSRKYVLIVALALTGLSMSVFSGKAFACGNCMAEVGNPSNGWTQSATNAINQHVTQQFVNYRQEMISIFWNDNILPAMKLMADQLSAVALYQTMVIGTYFDAEQQMKSQQSIQKLAARAHKDYHPSTGLCEFGSSVKSLAASDRRMEYTSIFMSQRSQDRALGQTANAAATGEDGDKVSRIRQFRTKYCDPADNNNGLFYLCDHDQVYTGGKVGAHELKEGRDGTGGENDFEGPAPERMNKDIDFVRTIETPWTLDINFTDTDVTKAEEDVLALASNLYGHEVFIRPPRDALADFPGKDITDVQKAYMDARAVVAKRSVAENSYNAITAMKAAGSPGSKDFLKSILKELGVDDGEDGGGGGDDELTELTKLLGENPSYYAQMEVLTKKIYQNPDFYTNLYDKPANVDRKAVALQAIALMQKFDLFKSYLRNEASMSVMLELAVMDLQQEVENQINSRVSGGQPGRR